MTLQSLDTALFFAINHGTANPLFDVLMPAFSNQGYLLVAPFLFYLIVKSAQTGPEERAKNLATVVAAIALACLAVYFALQIEDLVKNAVMRIRPCRSLVDVRLLVPCPRSFSLPSGHAITSFAFALPLWLLARGIVTTAWRSFPLVLAAAIAFSRVYIGVHYPGDVLAGAVLGTMIGLVLAVLYQHAARFVIRRSGSETGER
jgi:undecaprenyl-diphosphatase